MTTISERATQSGRRFDFGTLLNRFGTLGIFVVLVVVASLWSPSFLGYPAHADQGRASHAHHLRT